MRRLLVLLVPSVLVPLAPPVRAEMVERVVAKVNGQIITLSEFQSRQLSAVQAARIEPSAVGAYLRKNNARILQEAIDDVLLLQKAEDAGVKPPAPYVDDVIENIKKENNITSDEQFQAALQQEGLSFDEMRSNIERMITKQLIVSREVEPKVTIGEDELKEEYGKRRDSDFTMPARVTLQEILVKDGPAAEALAKDVVAKARAGEDFATLARTHSAAPSRDNGGNLGDIAEGDMNPDLRKVALSLSVGGVSEPLRVEGGYRIVKLVARTAASTTPYEGARERLRERLMRSRFESVLEGYIQDLRKNAQIELRVREVPLQLTGPIPEARLLEAFEADNETAPAPEARPPVAPPSTSGDEEVVTTPQSAPERIAPPASPGAPRP